MPGEIFESMKQAEERNTSRFKSFKVAFLAAVYLVLLTATMWLVHQGLYSNQSLNYWIWAAAGIMFSIITYTFLAMVFEKEWLFGALNLVSLVPYFFFFPSNVYVLAGGGIFFLLMVMFQQRIRVESKNQMHFSLRRVMNGSITAATYGFLFLIGFNLYYHISQDLSQHPERFYQAVTSAVTGSIPFVSERIADKTDLSQTLDQYLMVKAEPELAQNKGVTEKERQSFLQIYRQQFLDQFKISATGDETLRAVIDKIVATKVQEIFGKYSNYLPLIFTLLVIATLRLVAFIFHIVTMLVAYVLLQLLLLVRFFSIGTRTIEVKRLEV